MTEAEALTKRCPAPIGTMHDERTQNHCIGTGCMAWRWNRQNSPDFFVAVATHRERHGSTMKEAAEHVRAEMGRDGFCGLAGRP